MKSFSSCKTGCFHFLLKANLCPQESQDYPRPPTPPPCPYPSPQRNSAWHQVEVVTERLELTQQGSKVLQQQLDLCNTRYQMLLEDMQRQQQSVTGAAETLQPTVVR